MSILQFLQMKSDIEGSLENLGEEVDKKPEPEGGLKALLGKIAYDEND